ncbi:hypothetical protein BDP27DRAFT_1301860 [Rhodocollybia butyracea]|uniref:Protein kinase domain-containing protein n=1 Tax=Rhodocollybia butyracea TaxID=206335 RepID=A0A9P5PCW1_9AGAR|nr:hypothetical protein BDP27DRAFT_1301860 [Rhodocollybia butyracea]
MPPPISPRNPFQANEFDDSSGNRLSSSPPWSLSLAPSQDVAPLVDSPFSSFADDSYDSDSSSIFTGFPPSPTFSNHSSIAFEPNSPLTQWEHPSNGQGRFSHAYSRDSSSTKRQKEKGQSSSRSSSVSAKPTISPSLMYSSSERSSFLDFNPDSDSDRASSPQHEDDAHSEYSHDFLAESWPQLGDFEVKEYLRDIEWHVGTEDHRLIMNAIGKWWKGSLDTIRLLQSLPESFYLKSHLVEGLPSVFRLRSPPTNVIPVLHPKKGYTIFVIISSGAPGESQIVPTAIESKFTTSEVTSSADLRTVLASPDPVWTLMQVHHLWIPCVMELLQLELDDWANTDEKYRSLCMACIRKLSRAFNVLPPSLFLVNIQREHPHPIRGGGYADIWRGKIGDQAVCLKVLRMYLESDEQIRQKLESDFCHEALLWRQLRHPNVLPFFGVNTTLFGFCLVSPWMSNGDIVMYLKNHPDHNRRSVIMEIADGLNYLHSLKPPVVHGDVRGANILMNDDGHCCLADFGLAIASESTGLLTTTGHGTRGAIRWMAPELIHTGERSRKPLSRINALGMYMRLRVRLLRFFRAIYRFRTRRILLSCLLLCVDCAQKDLKEYGVLTTFGHLLNSAGPRTLGLGLVLIIFTVH